jgi:hypothetical protein
LTRTLFVHVGPAKTGTSAVQDILRAHDNAVVIYPKVGLWPDGSHHNLVLNFLGDFSRAEVVPENVEELFDRIADEAVGSDRDVVISSEILAGHKRAADFIHALRARLGANWRVEILFVVRDHLERAASIYNQRVKDPVFCERRDPDQFLVEQAAQMRYARPLRRLRRTKLDVTVLNYHPAGNFVARVLKHLGFAEGHMPATPMRNVSLSPQALVATLAANRVAGSSQDRDRIVAALRKMPNGFAPSQIIFAAQAIAEAEKEFARDREFLHESFGVDISIARDPQASGALQIGEADFDGIAAATAALGDAGAKVREIARTYVRRVEEA